MKKERQDETQVTIKIYVAAAAVGTLMKKGKTG
jgi:hypothetical protein